MIQNNFLYSNKMVIIVGGNDRWIDNNDNEVYRTDDNLEDRQDKFGANIQCSQILLTKSFRQYLETIMLSYKVWKSKTHQTRKDTSFKQTPKKLTWTLRGAKDNLTGWKFYQFATKAINVPQFQTAKMPNAWQE